MFTKVTKAEKNFGTPADDATYHAVQVRGGIEDFNEVLRYAEQQGWTPHLVAMALDLFYTVVFVRSQTVFPIGAAVAP